MRSRHADLPASGVPSPVEADRSNEVAALGVLTRDTRLRRLPLHLLPAGFRVAADRGVCAWKLSVQRDSYRREYTRWDHAKLISRASK